MASEWIYEQERPYKGDVLKEKRRIYIHIYFNLGKAAEDEREADKPTSYDRLESTIKNHIVPTVGSYRLEEITPDLLQGLFRRVSNQYSYSTIKKIYDALNECFKHALIRKELVNNPLISVKLPNKNKFETKEFKTFTKEEIDKFTKTAIRKNKSTNDYKYRIGYGFILILNTGIRMAEALGLTWDCVNFEKRHITIKQNIVLVKNRGGKGNGEKNYIFSRQTTKTTSGYRIIPLNNNAIEALRELKNINTGIKSEYIFVTKNGTSIRPRNLQNTFESILKEAALEQRGLHQLRHTFASHLFNGGVDVKTVSELLGHANIRITYDTYIHLIKEQKVKAIECLDVL